MYRSIDGMAGIYAGGTTSPLNNDFPLNYR